MPSDPATDSKCVWEELRQHYSTIADLSMRDLFRTDPERADAFSLETGDIYVDFSKNRITRGTLNLLFKLAESHSLKASIEQLFTGGKINCTENRAALHTALRSHDNSPIYVDHVNITELVSKELMHMQSFANAFHNKEICGANGKPLDNVVHIGIGGSDLGPRLVVDALRDYLLPDIRVRFVANIDFADIQTALSDSDPESTLFIIASKSFNTLETKTNGETARKWLLDNGCTDISRHFIGISANKPAALAFGVAEDRYFTIWDWVGGRYSLWSAVGLPIALATGFERFQEILTGAYEMDQHFRNQPMDRNIPVILALLDIWYNNFFNTETHAFIPYDQSLSLLPEYLGQLFMESNGKNISIHGGRTDHQTSPVIWGSVGTNSQHAFFQLLHQGTRLVPVDFLAPLTPRTSNDHHHKLLLANCIAQGQALMQGEHNQSNPYLDFPGNRPSTSIFYNKLTPKVLGALLAMYEHRAFVQGNIWGINSFDQWGVELGKKLAGKILDSFNAEKPDPALDTSTKNLIALYKDRN
ncbi:MAG: glucose-6-phosphate isomerase [Gammaproteobacteria bacterium RBG_16_51_14]|nr:MAG: glucose-6-phosphate isomerase [Gammaproteobacteria bacterium RBG_16_51_14]